jgi:hypothetical protein
MVEVNLKGHFVMDLEHKGKKAQCVLNDEREPVLGTIYIDDKEKNAEGLSGGELSRGGRSLQISGKLCQTPFGKGISLSFGNKVYSPRLRLNGDQIHTPSWFGPKTNKGTLYGFSHFN